MKFANPSVALLLPALVALGLNLPAQAADAVSTASAKPAKAKPLSAAAAAAQARARSTTRAKELAVDTVEQVNAAQLAVADRVLTGTADCEFNQQITIGPMEGKPAHFHVSFGKQRFTMVPQETTTGAVRLEDKRAGVVWLQIPAKSMLMNAKIGQRMVDGCSVAEQRAAVNAVNQATGGGLGVVPGSLPAAAAVPVAAPAAPPVAGSTPAPAPAIAPASSPATAASAAR